MEDMGAGQKNLISDIAAEKVRYVCEEYGDHMARTLMRGTNTCMHTQVLGASICVDSTQRGPACSFTSFSISQVLLRRSRS